MASKTALLVGATGLIGKAIVEVLEHENHYDKIIVVTRKSLPSKDDRIEEIIIEDFDKLEDYSDKLVANDYYCALGTTFRKAGSEEEFRKVNVDLPVRLAKIAKQQPDFEQFLVVTAYGADSESPIPYTMIKGEAEDQLVDLGLDSLQIFQPSLVTGHRNEFRLSELVSRLGSLILSFFIISRKRKLNSVKDLELAKAMFNIASRKNSGVNRYTPKKIRKIAYS